jgi:hypothetical protein
MTAPTHPQPEPVRLRVTRRRATELFSAWVEGLTVEEVDPFDVAALAAAWGLTFAPEPAPPAAEELAVSAADAWEGAYQAASENRDFWKSEALRLEAEVDSRRTRIAALLAELAERTQSRDEWSAACVRLEGQRDAARREVAELRRRVASVRGQINRKWAGRGALHVDLYRWEYELEQALRGTRPLPGGEEAGGG